MVAPDQILTPLAAPTGPHADDAAVVLAFAAGVPGGQSPRFHVEAPALMVDRSDAAALRIGPSVVLVRTDLDDEPRTARPLVERALTDAGLARLDDDTPLATPVAIQVLGLRFSSWDLWGTDLETAFAALRAAAIGDDWNPLLSVDSPPTVVL